MTFSDEDILDLAGKWFMIGFNALLGAIIAKIIIAVVLEVIGCLKKAGIAFHAYAPINTTDQESLLGDIAIPPRSESFVVAIPPDDQRAQGPRVHGTTMEIFRSTIAKGKPKRFSRRQLEEFTQNFTTELGSGAFGEVFKGEFPDGVQFAVKKLNNNPDSRIEEQFMAEYEPELRPTMSTVVTMLEGGMEITPPPYPKFQYLESFFERNGSVSGGNEISDPLPSATRTSDHPVPTLWDSGSSIFSSSMSSCFFIALSHSFPCDGLGRKVVWEIL
ncbi:unnamed protein product [Ilex paraguariensis]|uniref:Protein kinase domain-containing protein n=1 Tax=Ilex paraguariensis TaxID=185542 RepID=A0ABC8TJ53_9AQUA